MIFVPISFYYDGCQIVVFCIILPAFFLAVLELELRASHLLGRHPTT
jgi:hypothetical protein